MSGRRVQIHNADEGSFTVGIEINTQFRDVSFWFGKRAVVVRYGRG